MSCFLSQFYSGVTNMHPANEVAGNKISRARDAFRIDTAQDEVAVWPSSHQLELFFFYQIPFFKISL